MRHRKQSRTRKRIVATPWAPASRSGMWLLTAVLLHGAALGAQGTDPAQHPGHLTVLTSLQHLGDAATAAEARDASAVSGRLLELLRHNPAAASPTGYVVEVRFDGEANTPAPNPGSPFYFGLDASVVPYYFDADTRSVQPSHGGSPLAIHVNRLDCALAEYPYAEDANGAMYLEPDRPIQVHGIDLYMSADHHASCFVLTKSAQPPWVPVSRERYLKAAIASARGKASTFHREVAASSPSALLQQYESGRAKEDADARAQYEQMKKVDPRAAEQFLAAMKMKDSAMRAGLGQAAGGQLERDAATADTIGDGRIRAMEAELAAMPAAERARPAVLSFGAGQAASFLQRAGDNSRGDSVRRVVAPNPALYARTLPNTAPQLITVELGCEPAGAGPEAGAGGCAEEDRQRFRLLIDGMDWAGLKAMLKP